MADARKRLAPASEQGELPKRPTPNALSIYGHEELHAYMDALEARVRTLSEQLADQIEKTRAAEEEREVYRLKFAPLLELDWIGHTKNAQLVAMSNAEGLRLIKRAIYALHTKPDVEAELAVLRSSQAGLLEAIQTMLDSAVPHPVEHPTMTKAWTVGRAAIALAQTTKEPMTDQLGKAESK